METGLAREGRARPPIGSGGAQRYHCAHAQWRRGEVAAESRCGFRTRFLRTGLRRAAPPRDAFCFLGKRSGGAKSPSAERG